MQQLPPLTLCNITRQIIEAEFCYPDFTSKQPKSKDLYKIRYLYVYVCRTTLNTPFTVIRETLPCYQYSKTIYQVFRRAYLRRKEPEFVANFLWVENKVKEQIKQLKINRVSPVVSPENKKDL